MRTGMMARLAAGLILVAAAALASAEEHRGADAIKKAAAGAKISLAQAIETAQKEVTGGKVIEAGLETEKDATFYEVVVLSGDAVKEVKVDAASGKVFVEGELWNAVSEVPIEPVWLCITMNAASRKKRPTWVETR